MLGRRGKLKYCQTPHQLENRTQFQLVGVGVDFVFPKEGRKVGSKKKKEPSPRLYVAVGMSLHVEECLNFDGRVYG